MGSKEQLRGMHRVKQGTVMRLVIRTNLFQVASLLGNALFDIAGA